MGVVVVVVILTRVAPGRLWPLRYDEVAPAELPVDAIIGLTRHVSHMFRTATRRERPVQ